MSSGSVYAGTTRVSSSPEAASVLCNVRAQGKKVGPAGDFGCHSRLQD